MTNHITPSVSWSQQSSEAIGHNNAIRLFVSIPDIETSCLKCTTAVMGKTLSFRAFSQENIREAKYAFDLVLYAEVDSERMMVKQDLTEKCLVITLTKSHGGSEDWPRLQEDEEVAHYVSRDPRPWAHQHDNIQHGHNITLDLGHPSMPAAYFEQCGIFFFKKFQRFGQICDIQNSIFNFEQAVERTPDSHEEMSDRLCGLGGSLILRFDCLGNLEDITKAISTLEDAVRLAHEGDSNLPNIFSNLGIAYRDRFERLKQIEDINRAIFYDQKLVDITPWDPENHPRLVSSLVRSHESRFKLTKNLEDLGVVIAHFQKMADSCHPSHENFPHILSKLGDLYGERFDCTEEMDDIDRVIKLHRKVVDSAHSNNTVRWRSLNNLGVTYKQRFEISGSFQDIESAISLGHKAVDYSPSDVESRSISLVNLANSYLTRFKRREILEDVDMAIVFLKEIVDLSGGKGAASPGRLNKLGNAYVTRFERTGDLQDIESAIPYLEMAVDSADSSRHAELPSWLHSLGYSYTRRFEHSGNIKDIDLAISFIEKAVDHTPLDHDDLSRWYNGLGHSYARRYEHTGSLQDIELAILNHRKAIESNNSKTDASLCTNLGSSYLLRFTRMGNLDDINSAILYHKKAIESTTPGHIKLSTYLGNLGRSYLSRFERIGDLQDNDYALLYNKKSIDSTPPGHADLPRRLHNLGDAHLSRFMVTGDLQDIDSAILYHQKSLESTSLGHADLPTELCGLGYSYRCRFEHTGELQDINNSIMYHQKAVDSTPSGHAESLPRLNLLANAYDTRFRRTKDVRDIELALLIHQKVIDSAPPGHALLPNWCNNIGTSFEMRFEHSQDLKDIDTAIMFIKKALDYAPPDHTSRGAWFSNLGNSYGLRFNKTGVIDDIDSSISYFQKGADLTSSGQSNLSSLLRSLGTSYHCRFKHNDSNSDMQASISLYRRGSQASGTPSDRLDSARNAALLAFIHDQPGCLENFSLTINLLAEVAGLEQTIRRRHANIQGRSSLIRVAVAVALDFGRLDLALEWLEQGRCLVWNQIDQLRTPIDDLSEQNPLLADRFTNIARALESHGTREVSATTFAQENLAHDIQLQDQTLDHTRLAGQYRKLLTDIRSLPNFETFLRPPTTIDILASLPPDGPVIVFNIHKSRCDALALTPDKNTPLHIPLTDFDMTQAEKLRNILQFDVLDKREAVGQERASRRRRENAEPMKFILKELWEKIVMPILEALKYDSHDDPSKRPRIWWCPTGPLAFLPLHAAGIYGSDSRPGSHVFDYAVSSYTPTVRSVREKYARSKGALKSTKFLLISQPETPGLNPIPSARKETHDIKRLMEETSHNALLLEGTAATGESVLNEMKTHSWVHFACHGVQDYKQPLGSGLCLHDGRLDLLEIMKQRIPNPDLAFLSACQTSMGDNQLSDEVVHLAAGMLSAGYRGVVSTMWNISDEYGPKFAIEFYEYLLRGNGSEGIDGRYSALALDHATTKVRQGLGDNESSFMKWVPYVYFGY